MRDYLHEGTVAMGRAQPVTASFAPPFAPLAMPKQVLTPEAGGFARMIGFFANGLAQLKHSFRRIG